MRDDKNIGSKVSRLLRVLVAGGVALAGADGVRAAEEPAAPAGSPAPAGKGEQDKEKAKDETSRQKTQGKKEVVLPGLDGARVDTAPARAWLAAARGSAGE